MFCGEERPQGSGSEKSVGKLERVLSAQLSGGSLLPPSPGLAPLRIRH